MKTHSMWPFAIVLAFHSVSSAEYVDLPNPYEDSVVFDQPQAAPQAPAEKPATPPPQKAVPPAATATTEKPKAVPPPPPPPAIPQRPSEQDQGRRTYTASVRVNNISRKSGGELTTITLSDAIPLRYLELKVLSQKVKVHSASLVTTTGQTVVIREFNGTSVLDSRRSLSSENFNLSDNISAINLKMESYGGSSSVELVAISEHRLPQLSLSRSIETVTTRPQPPAPAIPGFFEGKSGRRGNCNDGFCVGDSVFLVQSSGKVYSVTLLEMDSYGQFKVRFNDGDLGGRVGDGWSSDVLASRAGRYGKYSVGEKAFIVRSNGDVNQVTILGFQRDGRHVVRFDDGRLAGQLGSGWTEDDLATRTGRSNRYAVGDNAFIVRSNGDVNQVTILGFQTNGRHVVRFNDGKLAGELGSNWTEDDLATRTGRSSKYAVGDNIFIILSNGTINQATILGFQTNGRHVVRFNDGEFSGQLGSNWTDEYIVIRSGSQDRFSVGDVVRLPSRNGARATILGIRRSDSTFVIRFDSGELAGKLGSGWLASRFERY